MNGAEAQDAYRNSADSAEEQKEVISERVGVSNIC